MRCRKGVTGINHTFAPRVYGGDIFMFIFHHHITITWYWEYELDSSVGEYQLSKVLPATYISVASMAWALFVLTKLLVRRMYECITPNALVQYPSICALATPHISQTIYMIDLICLCIWKFLTIYASFHFGNIVVS